MRLSHEYLNIVFSEWIKIIERHQEVGNTVTVDTYCDGDSLSLSVYVMKPNAGIEEEHKSGKFSVMTVSKPT